MVNIILNHLNVKGIMDISMPRNWQPKKNTHQAIHEMLGTTKGGPVLGLLKFTYLFTVSPQSQYTPNKSSSLNLVYPYTLICFIYIQKMHQ